MTASNTDYTFTAIGGLAMPRDMLEDLKIAAEQKPVEFGDIATLHELLAFALSDFQKVLDDPRYDINMNTWHKPATAPWFGLAKQQVCHVCLAGSVIAMSLGALPNQEFSSRDFNDAEDSRLGALDALRNGDIYEAFDCVYGPDAERPDVVNELQDKWEDLGLQACSDADNKAQGASLMRELRRMYKDLEAAKL